MAQSWLRIHASATRSALFGVTNFKGPHKMTYQPELTRKHDSQHACKLCLFLEECLPSGESDSIEPRSCHRSTVFVSNRPRSSICVLGRETSLVGRAEKGDGAK